MEMIYVVVSERIELRGNKINKFRPIKNFQYLSNLVGYQKAENQPLPDRNAFG